MEKVLDYIGQELQAGDTCIHSRAIRSTGLFKIVKITSIKDKNSINIYTEGKCKGGTTYSDKLIKMSPEQLEFIQNLNKT